MTTRDNSVSPLDELHEALDEAIFQAYRENVGRHGDGEWIWDGDRPSDIYNPYHTRKLLRLQRAAWDAIKERVEDVGTDPVAPNQWAGSGRSPYA
jgi:hypothetical protein